MISSNVGVNIAAGVIALGGIATAFWFHRKKNQQDNPPTVWREVAKLVKIHLYPLKSGHRIELQSADCTKFGLVQTSKNENALRLHDRSFVVADESGEFKTARTFPKMVLIEVGVYENEYVCFNAPGMRELHVKIPSNDNEATTIRVHLNEAVFAMDCGNEAATWFSQYIYEKDSGLRLAYHDGSEKNKRDYSTIYPQHVKLYKGLNDATGLYSDLTAVLLINQASVDDLNAKIDSDTVITAEHFRANLIIEGDAAPPFIEDYWKWIRIGDAIFKNVKPCTRCMLTTINPFSAVQNSNHEPLKTLQRYRKQKQVIEGGDKFEGELTVMGANLGVYQQGEFHLGDLVYVGI